MLTPNNNPDAAAANKDLPHSSETHESKRGCTDPPHHLRPRKFYIASIRNRLARIVNHELERMETGEIEVLSEQQNNMLQQLASLSVAINTISTPAASLS